MATIKELKEFFSALNFMNQKPSHQYKQLTDEEIQEFTEQDSKCRACLPAPDKFKHKTYFVPILEQPSIIDANEFAPKLEDRPKDWLFFKMPLMIHNKVIWARDFDVNKDTAFCFSISKTLRWSFGDVFEIHKYFGFNNQLTIDVIKLCYPMGYNPITMPAEVTFRLLKNTYGN